MFTTAVMLVAEFTVIDGTVIPAVPPPMVTVVRKSTKFIPVMFTCKFCCPCAPMFGVTPLIVGGKGPTTMMEALEALTALPLSYAEAVTLLIQGPACACVPITFTLISQKVPAASDPPVRLTEFDPAVAVVVPPQLGLKFRLLGFATVTPAGKLSVKLIPVRPVL